MAGQAVLHVGLRNLGFWGVRGVAFFAALEEDDGTQMVKVSGGEELFHEDPSGSYK